MLPHSKSKRITVDGDQYRYIVNESGATHDAVVPIVVTAQKCVENGSQLRVVGLTTCRVPEERSKYYMGRTVDQTIGPRDVAQLLKLALSRGWKSTASGPAFVLQVANADVFPPASEP